MLAIPVHFVQSGRTVEFVVLAKSDGSDRALVSAEQSASAIEHGFDAIEFRVNASTRGAARLAWDAHRRGDDTRPMQNVDDDAYGIESLTDAERAAAVVLVTALVEHDRPVLEAAGAYAANDDDPYLWTKPYGRWDRVDLALPPGDPRHWSGGVDRGLGRVHVVVDMWTIQEGPSDLSLEAELVTGPDGQIQARFDNLHVM